MDKAIYRIIDANFNRAREGLRVAEEFCRFALNNELLSNRCKELRHRLSKTAGKFDIERLICARDTENDIGRRMKIENQMKRGGIEDCVSAAFARAAEALRVIAETTAILETKPANDFEKLRYDCYILEKDISLFGFPALKFAKTRLYVIINVEDCPDCLLVAKAAAQNGADCLQLRAKKMTDAELLAMAKSFVDLCKQNNVISIINDRVDIAVAAEADGIHLGQNDLPIEQIRKFQLKPLITGISTHSTAELQKAVKQHPHYAGLGSCFPTTTKQVNVCGLDYVKNAVAFLKDKSIESVAVGGINPDNVEKVLEAGAKRIAVSSCACKAANPAQICKIIKEKILNYLEKTNSK